MELEQTFCKNCGAPLHLPDSADHAVCEHCGSEIPGRQSPAPRKPEIVWVEPPPAQAAPVGDDPKPKKSSGIPWVVPLIPFIAWIGIMWIMHSRIRETPRRDDNNGRQATEGRTRTRPRRARSPFEQAEQTVEQFSKDRGRLPNDDEGTELLEGIHGPAGNPLQYAQDTVEEYRLIAPGRDKKPGTDDDLTRTHRIASVAGSENGANSEDGAKPADLAECVAFLKSPGRLRKRIALHWLAQSEVAIDESRDDWVPLVLAIFKDPRLRDDADVVLKQTVTRDDAEYLLEQIEAAEPGWEDDFVAAALGLLIHVDAKPQVIALIHHRSSPVRKLAEDAVRDWNDATPVIIEQCIEDLPHASRGSRALDRLATLEIEPRQRPAVAAALNPLLLSSHGSALLKATELLENCGVCAENFDTLVEVYERPGDASIVAGRLLHQLNDPRAVPHFASSLANEQSRFVAREYLVRVGPAAETRVWDALGHSEVETRRAACQVLAEIGTARSLPYLNRLGEDAPVVAHAEAAIRAIVKAKRTPVDSPDESNDGKEGTR